MNALCTSTAFPRHDLLDNRLDVYELLNKASKEPPKKKKFNNVIPVIIALCVLLIILQLVSIGNQVNFNLIH